jgi:predicted aspartyl protease
MALSLQFEFTYDSEPFIPVTVTTTTTTDRQITIRALIDTGAQATLLDQEIARILGVDLAGAQTAPVSGIGGNLSVRFAEVTLLLLEEPSLDTQVMVAFAPQLGSTLGNLIGLDVLAHFDFGLSHASRLGYLGKQEA